MKGSANRPRRASAKSATVSHTARITVHTAARPAQGVTGFKLSGCEMLLKGICKRRACPCP